MRADLTDFEKSSIKDYKDRFTKWHSKQIDLLTFCINLNFTVSIAISGFIISNQDKPIFKDQNICDKYSLTKSALCILAAAATIGVLALISRLNDFRLTKNVIKVRRRIFEIENDIKYEVTSSQKIRPIQNREIRQLKKAINSKIANEKDQIYRGANYFCVKAV